jgi:hypothetical protein
MKATIKGVEMLGNRLVQDKIHIQIDIFLSENDRKIVKKVKLIQLIALKWISYLFF